MFNPVAQKAWKCSLCKEPVIVGKRYIHYIDRRVHEIINYRFHHECFGIVHAFCWAKQVTEFTPVKVRNWAKKEYCMKCGEGCTPHPCDRLKAVVSHLPKRRKIENTT